MTKKSPEKKRTSAHKKTIKIHKEAKTNDKTRTTHSFEREIRKFVLEVDSLSRANNSTIRALSESLKKSTESFKCFLEEKGIYTTEKDGRKSFKVKPHDLFELNQQIKHFIASMLAVDKVPQIFFCSLIHQYDAYLGKLLRVAFYVKPDILNASQKQLTFAELMAFPSLDEAREYLIEKEIETIVRDSHAAQFDWMENRFSIPLKKGLFMWPQFVEMTERRNLFVHCDGIVSSQYLTVCQKHNVKFETPVKLGDQLRVSQEYFDHAVECIIEIGVKLGHVLWRKIMPDNLQDADEALQFVTYELLLDERYSLAKTLLLFAVDTLKKYSSDEIHRINLVNLAIAHYYLGEKEEVTKLLDGQDWSACKDKFKLAVAVLKQNYTEATKIMHRIGSNGEVTREDYSSWPLFRDFRKSPKFLKEYKVLFGNEFVVPEKQTDQRLEVDKTRQQVAKTFAVLPPR